LYTEAEIKEAGLDDFRVFLREVWKFLRLPEPTPVQLDIAYYLQHGPDKCVILGFRGVAKTWITATYAIWCLFLDPQFKVMIVSASQTHADAVSIFCRKIISGMPLLQHLEPRPGQRDSGIAFDVGPAGPDVSPSMKSVGITGQLTGGRADLILPDDIEIPKNSATQLQREKLLEAVKEFSAVLKPGGKVKYLGTPQTEDSLYEKLPERGYEIRIWPADIPEKPDLYRGRLAPIIMRAIARGVPALAPVEPSRFPMPELRSRMAEYGRSGYALQFRLDTSLSDIEKHPLKARDLIIEGLDDEMAHMKYVWGHESRIDDLPSWGLPGDCFTTAAYRVPEMGRYHGCVMAIDPSGKGKDETAYSIVKLLNGTMFLVANGGFLDGYGDATLRALSALAKHYRVTDAVSEENFGGGMFSSLLKPHLPGVQWAEDVWHSQQKEKFICDTLEPVLLSHRLVVSRRVIEADRQMVDNDQQKYSLIYQMTRMHRDKGALAHEDRLETVAMAAQFYKEQMDRDQDAVIKAREEDALVQSLAAFQEGMGLSALLGLTAGNPSNLLWNGPR
jgi:hypothetical protein